MKQKHVDASREIRLWLGQIIIPTVSLVYMFSPTFRDKTRSSYEKGKEKVRNIFNRAK